MYLCVTSNLWARSTLLLFTAQLSVQPFHTIKEHDSVKGILEQFMNLKNKLSRFSFFYFISVLLPFCKKPGIFSPLSVTRLVSHLSASTYPWTWSSSPPGAWLWLGLGHSLAIRDLASSTCFSWHFQGRAECSTGNVLQRNLGLLPCAASTEQIQGCGVTAGFSSDKTLGREPRVSWNWTGMRADPLSHPPEKCKHRNGWLHLKAHLPPATWTGAFTPTPLPWGFPNKSQDQLLSRSVGLRGWPQTCPRLVNQFHAISGVVFTHPVSADQ